MEEPGSRASSPEVPFSRPIAVHNRFKLLPPGILLDDLSEGKELFPVRLRNDLNRELPKMFHYVTGIETLVNYQRTPVVCDCVDGCDTSCKCMYDSFDASHSDIPYHENTGKLAVISSEWAGAHRVIWECSAACRCGSECPSRSAQLGCRLQLEVFMTEKKGWGVRPLRKIAKGSFIAEYAGQMKCAKDAYEYNENDWYSFDITSEDGPTNYYIDASAKGNMARFINHSCEPNLIAVHVFYDDNNPHTGMHICFYASKDIQEGEELCFDYGTGYWEAKMKRNIGCECGSEKCQYRCKKKKSKKMRAGRRK